MYSYSFSIDQFIDLWRKVPGVTRLQLRELPICGTTPLAAQRRTAATGTQRPIYIVQPQSIIRGQLLAGQDGPQREHTPSGNTDRRISTNELTRGPRTSPTMGWSDISSSDMVSSRLCYRWNDAFYFYNRFLRKRVSAALLYSFIFDLYNNFIPVYPVVPRPG